MNLTNPIANPYVGPETFTQAQGKLFFGREREARDLLSRVLSERLVLFYAQSGAGKSSLLNARLIPSLREVGYAVLPVTRVGGELPADIDQVDNIYLFNLMLRIDKSTEEASRFAHVGLGDFLHGLYSDDGEHFVFDELAVSIPDILGSDTQPVTPYVLIIDQFEEIITAHPGRWKEREAFFRQLDAAMRRDPNLWVVLTLREDYVPSIEPYAPLLLDRMRARFYMERMGVDAALEAVRRPAEMGGRPFDSGVAERLVDNLRQVRVSGQQDPIPGQYVEPVQLQVVCYQLWEKIRHRPMGSITEADRQEAGDVDQALGQFYEDALGKVINDPALDVSDRQLRTWFGTQLITEAGTRGTVFQGQESTAGLDNKVVDVLESRRLLRKEVRAGGVWVELIHDRFVEPIREINRQQATPLALDAERWNIAGEPNDFLYGKEQLTQYRSQLIENPGQFAPLEQSFLEASIRRDDQRLARQRRWIGLGVVAALVVLTVLTGWALTQASVANIERQKAEQSAVEARQQEQRAIEARLEAEGAVTAQAVAISTKDAESKFSAELASSLRAALATQQAGLPIPTRQAGTPGEPPIFATLTPDATAIAFVGTVEAQLAIQSARSAEVVNATATVIAIARTAVVQTSSLNAVLPPIPLTLRDQADYSGVQLQRITGPIRLPVLQTMKTGSDWWVQVSYPATEQIGWLLAFPLVFEGDKALLPSDLQFQVITDRADLPFIYGQVVRFGQSTGDYLLSNPYDEQSGVFRISVGSQVTVLDTGKGSTSYGSGEWLRVSYPDIASALVWRGWLPVEVVAPQTQSVQTTVVDITATPTPSATPRPTPTVLSWPPPGRIVFVSNRSDPIGQLYLTSTNGEQISRLASTTAFEPSYTAAEGGQVIFSSWLEDRVSIYRWLLVGTQPINLTGAGSDNWEPSVSADGRKIAFVSSRDNLDWEIYSMNIDGSEVTLLTNDDPARNTMPAWSPSGDRITFVTVEGCGQNICPGVLRIMAADGSNPQRIFSADGKIVSHPAWSPDGRQITFSSNRDGNMDIFVMNVDGSNVRNLTRSPQDEDFPTWSLDGNWLAFSRFTVNNEIFVMAADGSRITQLTNNPASDWYPVWVR